MLNRSILRRLLLGASTGMALAVAGISVPVFVGALTPAYAQVSAEFQEALEQYGEWRPHPRFGEVWVPTGVPDGWRPYEVGHWVFTDEWGWYWVSDDEEADWGWVTYHYGRWAFDRGLGWFWVPGDEWAPAWVDWRYGEDTVGWAPLPPPDVELDAYEAEPAYWMFVPTRYIAAPRLRSYYVARERREFFLGRTRIVNRTLAVNGARIAVNPGISPRFIARATHAPLPTYRVQPRVFGSTLGVAGAVRMRPEDLRARRAAPGAPRINAVAVQRTTTVIQPATVATPPQPLNKGEHGRLGSQPPRAAQGGVTPQPQTTTPPGGGPLRTGPAPVTTTPTTPRTGPAPVITTPTTPRTGPAPVTTSPPPPIQTVPRQPAGVPPAPPPPPPPVVHTPPPPPPPPPVVHAPPPPPPPVVHAPPPPPPPVVHAPPPPPPVVRAPPPPPPPAARAPAPPPPTPGEKKPDPPK